jgi:hypothetical protein
MSEGTSTESGGTTSGESADVMEQTQTEEIVVDRPAEELARKLKAYANENEKRRHAEKALKQQLEDAKAKLRTAEEAKLKEEGKHRELAEQLSKQLNELQGEHKKTKATYAYKTVTSQIKEQAMKSGCLDTESMIQLAAAKGLLDTLEPDDEFNLPSDTVKQIVSEAQKSMPFLFGKQAPVIRDGNPPTKVDTKTSLESIPLNERIKQLVELNHKRGH